MARGLGSDAQFAHLIIVGAQFLVGLELEDENGNLKVAPSIAPPEGTRR